MAKDHKKPTRPRPRKAMDETRVEELAIALVRIREVRTLAFQELKPEHFDRDTEVGLAVLWEALVQVAAKYPNAIKNRLPYAAVRERARTLAAEYGLSEAQQCDLLNR